MKYVGETFRGIRIEGRADAEGEVEFEKCVFRNCAIVGRMPSESPVFHDVTIRNCTSEGCFFCGAVFSDVLVDTVRWRDLEFMWSCIFKHVTLRGKLGDLKILPGLPDSDEDSSAFDQAISRAYRTVDWALDISQASARSIEIRNIPAHLVRRDSETQAVVRRESVERSNWKEVAQGISYLIIKELVEYGYDDVIIVAPKGDKKRLGRVLEQIRALRDAGIADPD